MEMMKRSLFFIFIIAFLSCNAKNYIVYNVKGVVTVNQGVSVKSGNVLSSSDILSVEKESILILLSEEDKKLYTIKEKCIGKLDDLVNKKECSVKQLADSYLAFIKNKILNTQNSKGKEDKNFMQSAGTVYRETDSISIEQIISNHRNDSLKRNE